MYDENFYADLQREEAGQQREEEAHREMFLHERDKARELEIALSGDHDDYSEGTGINSLMDKINKQKDELKELLSEPSHDKKEAVSR